MENKKLIFLMKQNRISLLVPQEKDFMFDEHEIVNGVICNLTKVVNVIHIYLKKESLLGLPVQVLISQNLLQEFLVKDNELQSDLLNSAQIKLCLHKDVFYVAKIHPALLLQYQILFLRIGVYLEEITGYGFVLAKKELYKNQDAFMSVQNINDLKELIY